MKNRKKYFIIPIVICSVIGFIFGCIYGDFDKNGLTAEKYSAVHDFQNTINFEISGISAAIIKDEIVSQSSSLSNGIEISATVSENQASGSLVLAVHQKMHTYNPFKAVYYDFSYPENLTFSGTDRNGTPLILTYGGLVDNDREQRRIDEFFISYDTDRFVKFDEAEDVFPITINIEGHEVTLKRNKLF